MVGIGGARDGETEPSVVAPKVYRAAACGARVRLRKNLLSTYKFPK